MFLQTKRKGVSSLGTIHFDEFSGTHELKGDLRFGGCKELMRSLNKEVSPRLYRRVNGVCRTGGYIAIMNGQFRKGTGGFSVLGPDKSKYMQEIFSYYLFC